MCLIKEVEEKTYLICEIKRRKSTCMDIGSISNCNSVSFFIGISKTFLVINDV